MDVGLIQLVGELIDELDKSEVIKRINDLKYEIYSDQSLNDLLTRYKKESSNLYTKELIDIKNEIINDERIKEFRNLQYQLNGIICEINKRLTKLTKEKSCTL